jgi:2-oxoglutarate dehydrogenase E2 component (dihydrolipoamide succinyltransferase)
MIEVRVPDEQEGTRAVVRAWLRRVGDLVFENEPLVELVTDKVTQEVASPGAGVVTEILLDTDDEAAPGALLAKIDPAATEAVAIPAEAEAHDEATAAPSAPGTRPSPGIGSNESRLSPSVRRALLQHDIDPSRIKGTGRNGRITREILECFLEGRPIRVEYLIVEGGHLAGTGAHSYSPGNATKGSEEAEKFKADA